jgi:hypothetical protein
MTEHWLGHWDLCSIQWSDYCDCIPGAPVDLAEAEAGEPDEEGTT